MTSKNLFKKKSHNETDESQVAASHQRDEEPTVTEMSGNSTGSNKIKKTGSTTKKGTKGVDDEDTKRLSCDLPIPLHTSLRIGAALSERSMLGLIETLIIKHLMDRPADKIIADYHKSRDVRGTDTQ